jgi:hypothetical protein
VRYLKYLLLTDAYLIKGHLNTGGRRLSTFLNTTRKHFLEMDEVTIVNQAEGEGARFDPMLLRLDEILLAHEMEEAGDDGLRLLADQERHEVAIHSHFAGTSQLQLSGKVSRRALDRCASGHHDFIVVVEPQLLGLTGRMAQECAVLAGLPYLILNTNRLALICIGVTGDSTSKFKLSPNG